jgi:hypothetical protein
MEENEWQKLSQHLIKIWLQGYTWLHQNIDIID